MELFRSRAFTGANLLTLFLYGALGGTLFFLPLNLIQVQRYTPTQAGAALLPLILIIFLLSRWSGGLAQRYGARPPLILGPLIAAAGFALFVLPGVGGSYWQTFFPAVVVLGIGMAVSVAPLTTTVMNSIAQTRAGIASAINNAVSRTAGLLAIAVLGIVMLQSFSSALDARLPALNLPPSLHRSLDGQRTKLAGAIIPDEIAPQMRAALDVAIGHSFVGAFRRVMAIGAALAVASAVTAWVLIDQNRAKSASRPDRVAMEWIFRVALRLTCKFEEEHLAEIRLPEIELHRSISFDKIARHREAPASAVNLMHAPVRAEVKFTPRFRVNGRAFSTSSASMAGRS